MPLALGRIGGRGCASARAPPRRRRRRRSTARACGSSRPGRELIDTLDAVRRHDFSTRDLPGHGLKAVARHLGVAGRRSRADSRRRRSTRSIARSRARAALRDRRCRRGRGARATARRRRRSRSRRWCRGATSGSPMPGPATGVIDPLLVRAYLRAGAALPAHQRGRRHAAQRRGAAPVRGRRRAARGQGRRREPVSVADARVPDRPARDRLGALLALVDRLVEQRLAAKARGARGAGRLGRALHARGDVGGDEARRQLGVRLSRRAAGSRGSPTSTRRTK